MSRLRYFCVVSPPYLYHEIIVDGQGPYYEESDVVEVMAHSPRDAKALAIQLMSKEPHKYEHIRDCRSDGRSPYTGLKVYNAKGQAV